MWEDEGVRKKGMREWRRRYGVLLASGLGKAGDGVKGLTWGVGMSNFRFGIVAGQDLFYDLK